MNDKHGGMRIICNPTQAQIHLCKMDKQLFLHPLLVHKLFDTPGIEKAKALGVRQGAGSHFSCPSIDR